MIFDLTMTLTGAQIGTVIAMPISGILSDFSWDSVFYVFGKSFCLRCLRTCLTHADARKLSLIY